MRELNNNYDGRFDKDAYSLARCFMIEQIQNKILLQDICAPMSKSPLTADAFLDGYLENIWTVPKQSLNDAYCRLISSAQNTQGMPANIRKFLISAKNLDGLSVCVSNNPNSLLDDYVDILRNVLMNFCPKAVAKKYPYTDSQNSKSLALAGQQLFDDIRCQLQTTITPRLKSRSHWVRFPKSIVSGARFLSMFNSLENFRTYVERSNCSDKQRRLLANEIAQKVHGFGFALVSDFLKEMGYFEFSKPDVQIKDISEILSLTPCPIGDEDAFRAISRVAQNIGKTPYFVDKLFWLIGSGKFYHHNIKIGNNKTAFHRYARSKGYPVSLRVPSHHKCGQQQLNLAPKLPA